MCRTNYKKKVGKFMVADFLIRAFQPNKGNNPEICTVSERARYWSSDATVREVALREYGLYGLDTGTKQNSFSEPLMLKRVISYNKEPHRSPDGYQYRKSIYKKQPGTNNTTSMYLDCSIPGKTRYGENFRQIDLSRDLANGDVLELSLRKDAKGSVDVLKFSIQTAENIAQKGLLEYAEQFKKLDPLAQKWIRTVLKSIV